jgi:imidazolonepropionase-like amidohydrolase
MVSGGFLTAGSSPERLQFGADDLAAMVGEAHSVGLPVAAHAHSAAAVEISVRAGADTIEHCTFVDAGPGGPDGSALALLAGHRGWVCPTFVPLPGDDARRTARRRRTLRTLHRAGVRLVAGTDAGALPGVRHDSLPGAVLALLSVGVTPKNALAAATSSAATACGLDGRKGVLLPGADADLIALDADPLVAPQTICEPRAVFARGEPVDRAGGRID